MLRLPPRAARPAAELRRARAHGGRTVRGRPPRRRLPARSTRTRASPCCSRNSQRRGRSPRPSSTTRDETRGELDDLPRGGRDAQRATARGASTNCIISKTDGVSDMLEVGAAAARRPACCARARAQLDVNIVPLFETIDDLRDAGRHHGPAARRCPPTRALLAVARRDAGSDARLLRQQQGRRLPHLGLGALQGRDRAGRGVRAARRARCGCSTAAAARSAAAAARATRPSWRSRRARCRARSASPSRAR